MKIVIAEDSFKSCLSSAEAACAVKAGVLDAYPEAEVVMIPVADGGEGTVEAIVSATEGGPLRAEIVRARVSDPLGREIEARYGISGSTAIIEVAAACGLALLEREERNPLITTTKGVGELILDAIGRGCDSFLIGLGGRESPRPF